MTITLTPTQFNLLSNLSLGDRPLTPEDWDNIAEDLQVLVDAGFVSTDYSGELEVEKSAAYLLQDFDRGAFDTISTPEGERLAFHV
jgi:hypothetical protein